VCDALDAVARFDALPAIAPISAEEGALFTWDEQIEGAARAALRAPGYRPPPWAALDGDALHGAVTLRSAVTSKFVSAQPGPGGAAECNRDAAPARGWEEIRAERRGDGRQVALLATAHESYFSAQPDGRVECDRESAQAWEQFTVEAWGGVTVEDEAVQPVIQPVGGGRQAVTVVALRSAHGKFVTAGADGSLRCDADSAGPSERFVVEGLVAEDEDVTCRDGYFGEIGS
jgi:hypothetical protein